MSQVRLYQKVNSDVARGCAVSVGILSVSRDNALVIVLYIYRIALGILLRGILIQVHKLGGEI